jgi:hypothetical protein
MWRAEPAHCGQRTFDVASNAGPSSGFSKTSLVEKPQAGHRVQAIHSVMLTSSG